MNRDIYVPVSAGELFDKISILELKTERIADPAKLTNVGHELSLLRGIAEDVIQAYGADIANLLATLKQVNSDIWNAEDHIRDLERKKDFGPQFLTVARSIYRLNDGRAAAKREINLKTASAVVEEKSYAAY